MLISGLKNKNKFGGMENKYKPFERIIIRPKDKSDIWVCGLFDNYYDKEIKVIIGNKYYMLLSDKYEILPYEGNEHLVGTTNDPEKEVKLEKEEWIIASDNIYALRIGSGVIGRFVGIKDGMFLKRAFERNVEYEYAIRFKDFDPSNMEKTRKHILCVKNGKVVKYERN